MHLKEEEEKCWLTPKQPHPGAWNCIWVFHMGGWGPNIRAISMQQNQTSQDSNQCLKATSVQSLYLIGGELNSCILEPG